MTSGPAVPASPPEKPLQQAAEIRPRDKSVGGRPNPGLNAGKSDAMRRGGDNFALNGFRAAAPWAADPFAPAAAGARTGAPRRSAAAGLNGAENGVAHLPKQLYVLNGPFDIIRSAANRGR